VVERRLELREVHAHHAARGAHHLRGDLEPAARPAAEVGYALARAQQPLALLDLEQLVGGAGAVALALGALVEGILAVVGGYRVAFARSAWPTFAGSLLLAGSLRAPFDACSLVTGLVA
jgi:hypothetical protein